MNTYNLKYKRPGQWRYRKLTLIGQQYLPEADKLICRMPDGQVFELPEVSKCEIRYGQDMIDALKPKEPAHDDVPSPQG